MSDDDYQHALRAWTIADEYERTLKAWVETNLHRSNVQKVMEVNVRYVKDDCRQCTVQDASMDVVAVWTDTAGSRITTTTFDSPELLRSLSGLLADLAAIAEKVSRGR